MEEKQKMSQFFEAVTKAIEDAKQLKKEDDSMLLVQTDGVMAFRLVGGDTEKLMVMLYAFMKKSPSVADIVCRAALNYHLHAMHGLEAVRVTTPPVPEDGVAMWPTIDKDKTGIDYAD